MKKRLSLPGLVAATGMMLLLPAKADALGGDYTIQTGQLTGFYSATRTAFAGEGETGCNQSVYQSPAPNQSLSFNGLDARILPLGSGEWGRDIRIGWSSNTANPRHNGLRATVYDGNCSNGGVVVGSSGTPTANWVVHIPVGYPAWLVIESISEVQVSLHITTL
jgi:hypothetical protein